VKIFLNALVLASVSRKSCSWLSLLYPGTNKEGLHPSPICLQAVIHGFSQRLAPFVRTL